MRERKIPEATVARLPIYLRALQDMAEEGLRTVSSEDLARAARVNAAKVRKDLSYLGSFGTRGVGYDAEYLAFQISRELGLTKSWNVMIAGAGNLGHALARYKGFAEKGFKVVAILDSDPKKIGAEVDGHLIEDVADMDRIVKERKVVIGIVTTPASAAQEVVDRMVAAGVRSILNFAPVVLHAPPHVSIRNVDVSRELQILTYYEQRKAGHELVRRRRQRQ